MKYDKTAATEDNISPPNNPNQQASPKRKDTKCVPTSFIPLGQSA
jgi:hypothetical protein